VLGEHAKYARRLIRSLKRIRDVGSHVVATQSKGQKSTVPALDHEEHELAEKLTSTFGMEATLDEIKINPTALFSCLHSVEFGDTLSLKRRLSDT
jgi:adenylosuccinate lyase